MVDSRHAETDSVNSVPMIPRIDCVIDPDIHSFLLGSIKSEETHACAQNLVRSGAATMERRKR